MQEQEQAVNQKVINGKRYVLGDRYDPAKSQHVPPGARTMGCSNCPEQAIFNPLEMSLILAQNYDPLCVPCSKRLEGSDTGVKE